MIRIVTLLKISLIVGIIAYGALAGFLYLNQREFIFHPVARDETTPQRYGVDYEEVYFDSSDGTTLNGWWVPGGGRISLLYCHGNGANLSMLAFVSSIFQGLGFDTLLFDYRAYGSSGGDPGSLSEAALREDANAALAWLKAKRPGQPIVVWGHSLGAGVASRLAHEQRVDGLVLEGAFTSIAEMARYRYPWIPVFDRFLESSFTTGRYVEERHGAPLLMLHAEKDSVIPLQFGEAVYRRAAEPKEWILVEDTDHNDFPDVHARYRAALLSWIERNVASRRTELEQLDLTPRGG